MHVLLVDPSLFTGPYDAGLNSGLLKQGVETRWAIRPARKSEYVGIASGSVKLRFYRHTDNPQWVPGKLRGPVKALAHIFGIVRLIGLVWTSRVDVVHFQWAVMPIIDAMAMRLIRLKTPVVLTVHDAVPFNGEKISFLQNFGFDLPIRIADRVIVHTRSAASALEKRGIPEKKITILPHGPLTPVSNNAGGRHMPPVLKDGRRTFVLFGQIKPYKGVDILVEAVSRLSAQAKAGSRFIVAGAVMMDLTPIRTRIIELGLPDIIEIREGRLDEDEMIALFDEADAFIFPYRHIDASGVYYLVRGLGKWIIASHVGVFAEDFVEGETGRTVPPEDIEALKFELDEFITSPIPPNPQRRGATWEEIGAETNALYRKVLATR